MSKRIPPVRLRRPRVLSRVTTMWGKAFAEPFQPVTKREYVSKAQLRGTTADIPLCPAPCRYSFPDQWDRKALLFWTPFSEQEGTGRDEPKRD